jgi:hypothetical protein
MAKAICPQCGAEELEKIDHEWKCKVCGYKYTETQKKTEAKQGKGKKAIDLPGLFAALITLLVTVHAFQPLFSAGGFGFILIVIAIIAIGIACIIGGIALTAKTGGIAAFFGIGSLVELGVMFILLAVIIIAISLSSSPQLLKTVRIAWSLNAARLATYPFIGPIANINASMISSIIFIATACFACFISYTLKGSARYIFLVLWWGILFIAAIPILKATGLTEYVNIQKTVNVQYTVPYKTIPVSGGVNIQYGTKETNYLPSDLLGGQPYIYYYSLQNLYEEEEKFKVDPFIEIRYQYATVRFRANPSQNPQLNKPPYTSYLSLGNKSFYQDQLYYDPRVMKIETENACFYTEKQMKSRYGEDFKPACSWDNPTVCGDRAICAKVGDFLCDCLGWTALTCGGYRAYMGMNVWHTGFLRAKGTLFYKKEYFEPVANTLVTQGPFGLMPVFFPNPWVEALYNPGTGKTEYYTDVKMGVELENSGGGIIKIKSISAKPVNTEINTTVKGYSEELGDIVEVTVREILGIDLIKCDDSEIVNKELPNIRVYKEFCTFTKPTLKVSIVDLKVGKVNSSQEIEIGNISSYCKGELPIPFKDEKEKEVITKIMKLIGKTGLCEALTGTSTPKETEKSETAKSFAEEWREKIENSLKSVNVIIEVSYEREFTSPSRAINIFTSTYECLTYSCCHGGKNDLCLKGWSEDEIKNKPECALLK